MKKDFFNVTVQRQDGSTFIEVVRAVSAEDAIRIARDRVSMKHRVVGVAVC